MVFSSSAQPEIPIWAASDAVKIFKDSPFETRNIVWSSKDNSISLRGARNEVIVFQLVINGQDKGLSQVTVKTSPLKHSDGTSLIPNESWDLFLEWYTLVQDNKGPKFYPDALIPFYSPYTTEQYAVAALFDIKSKENQPVWVDLHIPPDSPAGKYKVTIEVLSGGKTIKTLNLNLTVFSFTIPQERHISAYSEMYGGFATKENLKDFSPESKWAMQKEYWLMAKSIDLILVPLGLN